MKRARYENMYPPVVDEEVNEAGNRDQNQERERTLEESWKPVLRDDYSAVRRDPLQPIIFNSSHC